jgi:hypothetical protein
MLESFKVFGINTLKSKWKHYNGKWAKSLKLQLDKKTRNSEFVHSWFHAPQDLFILKNKF